MSEPANVLPQPPQFRKPSLRTLYRPSPRVWIPVLIGLAVICFESTPLMSADNTGRWLTELWQSFRGHTNNLWIIHHYLRKLGHFTGYGTLGLLMRRAWHHSVRIYLSILGTRLMLAATALSVSFTFLVGCLDEWHQSVTPGRTSSFRDVLIDTCGALTFNLLFWITRWLRNRSQQRKADGLTAIGQLRKLTT